jgi:hypothetical protein
MCHEDIRVSGGVPSSFLTSALDGGDWSASRPCRFTPGERAYITDWIGGWVDSRAGLEAVKGKAIPVTVRGGPQGFEMSRLSHFLDNRLTDGGKAVSLTCRPPFTPRKIAGTHFC